MTLVYGQQRFWMMRTLSTGRPVFCEVFRSRQDALFAASIVRCIREDQAAGFLRADISAILADIATKKNRDMTDWGQRALCVKDFAQQTYDYMAQLPQNQASDLLQRIQEQEKLIQDLNTTPAPTQAAAEPTPTVAKFMPSQRQQVQEHSQDG